MNYQLVLQLPASSIRDYNAMIELEDVIIATLGDLGDVVDGHDAGLGEMNIFILTNEPRNAFDRVRQVLGTKDFLPELKVAFREIGKDRFTILYPPGLTNFAIS